MRKDITLLPYGMCDKCFKFNFLHELPDLRLCALCHDEYKEQQAFSTMEREHYFGKPAPN